jgi:hypothetical protein
VFAITHRRCWETTVSDGYQVDPEALRRAGGQVYDGSDAIGDAAALFTLTNLNADALGDVPAAAEFAQALRSFVQRHGTDLRHGSVWVNDAGDGVMDSATEYERHEDTAATTFDRISGPR